MGRSRRPRHHSRHNPPPSDGRSRRPRPPHLLPRAPRGVTRSRRPCRPPHSPHPQWAGLAGLASASTTQSPPSDHRSRRPRLGRHHQAPTLRPPVSPVSPHLNHEPPPQTAGLAGLASPSEGATALFSERDLVGLAPLPPKCSGHMEPRGIAGLAFYIPCACGARSRGVGLAGHAILRSRPRIEKKRNGLLAAPRKVSHERTGHRAAIPCRVPCSRSSRPAAMPRLRLHLRGRFMHSCHSCLSHACRTNTLHLSSLALLQHAGSLFGESFCSSYGHAVLPIGRDDSTGMILRVCFRCCGCSRRLSLLRSDRSR